jgi:hypothetical protein
LTPEQALAGLAGLVESRTDLPASTQQLLAAGLQMIRLALVASRHSPDAQDSSEMTMVRLRARLLALAYHLLARFMDQGPQTVTVSDESGTVTITVAPTRAPSPPSRRAVKPGAFSPVEQAVLEVLLEKPQTPEGIARQVGYALRTVRVALTALCRAQPPRIHRSADGYTRAPDL